MEADATHGENGKMQLSDSDIQDEDLGDGILKDLDSYWYDINGRLAISRMVSDSVIKGMVNAISQEAYEKINQKEFEVAKLNEIILKNKFMVSPSRFHMPSTIYGRNAMDSLKNEAKDQLKKLRKEINEIKGCSSMRKINSSTDVVGLSGILPEKVALKFTDVDKIVDDLQDNLDTLYKQVEDIVPLSKVSVGQWQDELEFLADIEGMVLRNYIRSIQHEFEETVWDQNAKLSGYSRKIWDEKIKEISGLRQELDIISRSLSPSEVGHLISFSSMDSDHSHRKVLRNGKHVTFKTNLPENVDPARLKHLTTEELVNHFNTEIIKMSRNHESQVHEITEENFTLKRELLKERERSSLLKKDKEFDMLRKKIPDIILKLDSMLMENEKLRASDDNNESLGTMRNRLDSIISENYHLKDSLEEKKKEVGCLSFEVSSLVEKASQLSILHDNSLGTIEKMKCLVQDAQIETSICEDVVKCFLGEMIEQIRFSSEESALEYDIMQEVYETVFQGAVFSGELASTSENDNLHEESIIMQDILGVTLFEPLKEAEEKMTSLNNRYIEEMRIRMSHEKELLHCGKALNAKLLENENLEEKLTLLGELLKEKEQLVQEITFSLEKVKEKFALASVDVGLLKDQNSKLEMQILKGRDEAGITKLELAEALQQVESLKMENYESKQKFEQATVKLSKVDEERRMLGYMVAEYQKTQSLVEEKERESRKQMESAIFVVQKLCKEVFDFEHRVIENISTNFKRLESLNSVSNSLIQNACIIKRTSLLYKQKLEKRCSDLQKAETEVDLLGDEVDVLVRLLEKIYIALDHYSPILHHYPGIVDILKLVKRELSRDTMKTAL